MKNESKFQLMLQLAEFGVRRMEERRSVEFRIFISYITLLVLALYQLIKPQNPIHDFFGWITQKDSVNFRIYEGVILYVLALFLHTIYVMWQVGIGIAMNNDSYRRNFYLKKVEDISGHSLKYDCKDLSADGKIIIIKHYLQQFCHLNVIWSDWSRMLVVAIPTILFVIVSELAIKKFNSDIGICWRKLLFGGPSLILFLIAAIQYWRKKCQKWKK